MSSLYERLNDAKLAGGKTDTGYYFNSNEEAAKMAAAVFQGELDSIKPGRLHPGVGVGCVFVTDDNQEILMIERDGSHGAGLWAVPGGWVDKGEEPWETVEREMLEETGMKVTSERTPFNVSTDVQDDVHSITLWFLCFAVRPQEPKIMEPEKCTGMQFRYLENLELASFPMFGSLREKVPVIREYLKSVSQKHHPDVAAAIEVIGANYSQIVAAINEKGTGGRS